MEKSPNTFNEGLNMDASDFVLQSTQLRYAKNIRFINLEGSNYVVTNLKGTEEKFEMTAGFIPVAAQEFNSILYLISWNATTTELEIGSYPSPGDYIWMYRPFQNFNHGDFRTNLYELATKPQIQKLEVQSEYDGSVNLLFTVAGKKPKIVNSKFEVITSGESLQLNVISTRTGVATSNDYNTSSLLDETTTILNTDKILKIAYSGLTSGGKIKPGNYVYVFHYMSEDLNKTGVVGQSLICQVPFGRSENSLRGGDENEQTSFRQSLTLSQVDTNFKFLKVYVMYSAGQDTVFQQYLEFDNPVEITGENMTFTHDGYEQLTSVSTASVNEDFAVVDAAEASTQVGGFYFLANITQHTVDFNPFRNAAAALTPTLGVKSISALGYSGYMDPGNVYNYMSLMGGESYPYGIVYVLPGNVTTPVFPLKGQDFSALTAAGAGVDHTADFGDTVAYAKENGVVTVPGSHTLPFISGNNLQVRHIKVNVAGIPTEVKNNSIGFFFVRGERKTDLLSQGVIIPTLKVPNIDGTDGFRNAEATDEGYYYQFREEMDNTNFFKHMPCLDHLLEAYVVNAKNDDEDLPDGDYDKAVIDRSGRIMDGFLPMYVGDMKARDSSYSDPWFSKQGETWARHWAFISGDALMSEPAAITTMHGRKSTGVLQIAKLQTRVKGAISPVSDHFGQVLPASRGMFYDFESYTSYSSSTMKSAENLVFVPGETLATGSDFVSKIRCSFSGWRTGAAGDGSTRYLWWYVAQNYNAYFGLEMKTGSEGHLADAGKTSSEPYGLRIGGSRDFGNEISGTNYSNMNALVPAGHLINVYESNVRATPNQLYKSINNVTYRQITPRYSWSENPGTIDIFGGDCYIAKVYRKLNQGPFRDPGELPNPYDENSGFEGLQNIDSGMLLSWFQESKYNLNLRQPGIFDLSEPGERSFFPYQSNGDFTKYRRYRLPETVKSSPGYSATLTPKDFFKISSLTPYVKNRFFSRVMHSQRHIPNAFKNGYRSFMPTALRDYPSHMGQIIGMFDQRGALLIVFEHGVGITTVEQRVETANDIAGGVFIQPSDVLPSQLNYYSKEVGCQHHQALVQTPSAVYGIDVSKGLIWQVRDGLVGISDQGFASFIKNNRPVNPRAGYDPENKEVLFTTDEYTICFREGLEKFTSFYSFKPKFYTRRGNELYSFLESIAHIHNRPVYTIYGEAYSSIVEFVVNPALEVTKVLDWVNIISNAVRPIKVEVFTYDNENIKLDLVNPAATHQYTKVEAGIDQITEEEKIEYRDKRFAIQIPPVTRYDASLEDDIWGNEGRMRNIYFIIRLTYNNTDPLELASVISTFRYSPS